MSAALRTEVGGYSYSEGLGLEVEVFELLWTHDWKGLELLWGGREWLDIVELL